MARCNNDLLLKKIGINTLSESTEIDFRIRKDLADCRRINTKDYIKITGDVTFNKYDRPVNAFDCVQKSCVTTGALGLAANGSAEYLARYDATDYAAGVITFYVKNAAQTTLTVKISDDEAQENADVYNITLSPNTGWAPVVVDLTRTPDSEEGNGWEATRKGAYISIATTAAAQISSIGIFDAIEDFELNDVVTVACLTTIGGTFDLEVVEAQCQEARYNDAVTTLTYPVTGTRVTPNYWKLNPLVSRGRRVKGFDMATTRKTVEAYNGKGRVTLPDMSTDVCGYIAIQLDDSCDITEAALTQLSVPGSIDVALDQGHYQVDVVDGVTYLYFSPVLVGMDVLIRYPRIADIEEMVASPENLGSVHTSMVVPHMQSDGVKMLYVFDNVYVTSFPATITNEASEFAFTITIGRDSDNNFFRIQRIVGA